MKFEETITKGVSVIDKEDPDFLRYAMYFGYDLVSAILNEFDHKEASAQLDMIRAKNLNIGDVFNKV